MSHRKTRYVLTGLLALVLSMTAACRSGILDRDEALDPDDANIFAVDLPTRPRSIAIVKHAKSRQVCSYVIIEQRPGNAQQSIDTPAGWSLAAIAFGTSTGESPFMECETNGPALPTWTGTGQGKIAEADPSIDEFFYMCFLRVDLTLSPAGAMAGATRPPNLYASEPIVDQNVRVSGSNCNP